MTKDKLSTSKNGSAITYLFIFTVKCSKEDKRLVNPDEKHSTFNNNVKDYIKAAGKHLDLYTGAIHPWSERIT